MRLIDSSTSAVDRERVYLNSVGAFKIKHSNIINISKIEALRWRNLLKREKITTLFSDTTKKILEYGEAYYYDKGPHPKRLKVVDSISFGLQIQEDCDFTKNYSRAGPLYQLSMTRIPEHLIDLGIKYKKLAKIMIVCNHRHALITDLLVACIEKLELSNPLDMYGTRDYWATCFPKRYTKFLINGRLYDFHLIADHRRCYDLLPKPELTENIIAVDDIDFSTMDAIGIRQEVLICRLGQPLHLVKSNEYSFFVYPTRIFKIGAFTVRPITAEEIIAVRSFIEDIAKDQMKVPEHTSV